MSQTPSRRDYSLVGRDAEAAVAGGLAAAEWYHTDIPRKQMKELMKRSDGPAIRDTLVWVGLLIASGVGGSWYWGEVWCVPFWLCYGVSTVRRRIHAGMNADMGPRSRPGG
jgi:fatty acid desaturase